MRRAFIVAFAIIGSLLVMSATPAIAGSTPATNTAVGSIHTTDTDFTNAAQLSNVSVVGSGQSAVVKFNPNQSVDNFEDGDVMEYSLGDTGSFSAQTGTVKDGAYSGEISASGTASQKVISTSGLNAYPSQGDVFQAWVRGTTLAAGADHVGLIFGAQDTSNYYYAYLGGDNSLNLNKVSGGSGTSLSSTSATVSGNTWYRIKVDWANDGTITITLYDSGGSQIAQTSATDSSFTSGGIGWCQNNGGGSAYNNGYYDTYKIIGSGVNSGTYISSNHTVSGVSSGFANISALSNASVEVIWQEFTGGSWSDIRSDTYTTSGNKTADLSIATSDILRVNVTFVKTGANPTAELHDEGVLFTNHAPQAANATASPQGGASQNDENVQLSIDVSDGEFGTAQGEQVTAEWFLDGSSQGTTAVNSNGTITKSLSVAANGTYTWHVVLSDEYGGSSSSDTFTFDVRHYDPILDDASASPNGSVSTSTPTLSIDVSDPDFVESSGSTDTITFYVDGSSVGTDSLSSNGTASYTFSSALSGESHTWHVTASDDDHVGNSATSATFMMQLPSNLSVRDELAPNQLVDNVEVQITAYYSGNVTRRSTTNGNISLSGLPLDEPIIVRANATGYYTRTAVIENVFQQNSVYLLNSTNSTYLDRFTLEDPVGNYPSGDTVLFVDRDLNKSGTIEWRTIAGDKFGVKGVPVYLQRNQRYRLRIKNLNTGDVVVVGAYTAIQSETVTVTPGQASFELPDVKRDYYWSVTENETAPKILVRYKDDANQTDSIKITIHERYNSSNVLVDNASFSTNGLTYDVPMTSDQANKTWMAELYIDRGDGYVHYRVPVNSGPVSLIPSGLDGVWVKAIGVFITLMTAMAFSQLNQGVGAITTSLVGGMLWYFGVFSGAATGAAVVIALGISIVFHYRNRGQY